MKKAKIIIDNNILEITYEKNPICYFEERVEDNGLKFLTGYSEWLPFKVNIISEIKVTLKEKHDFIYIVNEESKELLQLKDCKVNKDLNEISIKFSKLY